MNRRRLRAQRRQQTRRQRGDLLRGPLRPAFAWLHVGRAREDDVDDAVLAKKMIGFGVNNITTNRPGPLRAELKP